jgi:hypothetical protein
MTFRLNFKPHVSFKYIYLHSLCILYMKNLGFHSDVEVCVCMLLQRLI